MLNLSFFFNPRPLIFYVTVYLPSLVFSLSLQIWKKSRIKSVININEKEKDTIQIITNESAHT